MLQYIVILLVLNYYFQHDDYTSSFIIESNDASNLLSKGLNLLEKSI